MWKWCPWRLEMSSTYFFIVLICIWIIVCFYFFIDIFRGEPPIPEVLSRPHPDFKCSAASFNTPSWIFLCFFSTLWPKSLLASKKIKYVSFLFEVIRFAASFRLVDHIGENHVSAQFQISVHMYFIGPKECQDKILGISLAWFQKLCIRFIIRTCNENLQNFGTNINPQFIY